jgi:hypothetical protein
MAAIRQAAISNAPLCFSASGIHGSLGEQKANCQTNTRDRLKITAMQLIPVLMFGAAPLDHEEDSYAASSLPALQSAFASINYSDPTKFHHGEAFVWRFCTRTEADGDGI